MGLTMPDTWERRLIGENIIWVHHMQIHCYACGKSERVTVSVFEGKFNPDLEEEIKTDNGTQKIYPTFAPQGNMEWKVPDGWSQILHVTSDFYPNETITALGINLQQIWGFAKRVTKNHNWVDYVKNGGVNYRIERVTTWRDIFTHPIRYIRDIIKPEKLIITFDDKKLDVEMHNIWNFIWEGIGQQVLSPQEAFEKWYAVMQMQFAEWVCDSDECWMNAARKIRTEFNAMKELAIKNG